MTGAHAGGPEIHAGYRPGLLGATVAAHARHYAAAWGFGRTFETRVAAQMATFLDRFDPGRDLLLSAWEGGALAGTLTLDGADPEGPEGTAHLRWFIVARPGGGLGGRLIARAMAFADSAGFASTWLTTFAGLDAARRLYERHGFVLTAEAQAQSWGTLVSEQRWERPRRTP